MSSKEIIATYSQLDKVAEQILIHHQNKRIFSVSGEMGTGKTTLIKALCNILGIKNIPSSPTFSIVNEYRVPLNEPVYHFDFYRIETPKEAIAIGLYDYLESGNYCFMEWSEKIETILEEETVKIFIERIDAQTRKFTF
ncbi:MAG: tRNA (adenosine(37)-N6)-threonylcarbamoyltransferase complex ATPase subunit type 1 TsaE [Bacteroidales bacterium]|jgi:tRNA threonylcarbamoyladenosine biosynthesis protein TsaE|nr:tRNA (adenosine(37)-N6)-threonylcarbamoyltransferase complex ATPase subunit type 1 TsaE [Bacteroidales bacterium]